MLALHVRLHSYIEPNSFTAPVVFTILILKVFYSVVTFSWLSPYSVLFAQCSFPSWLATKAGVPSTVCHCTYTRYTHSCSTKQTEEKLSHCVGFCSATLGDAQHIGFQWQLALTHVRRALGFVVYVTQGLAMSQHWPSSSLQGPE